LPNVVVNATPWNYRAIKQALNYQKVFLKLVFVFKRVLVMSALCGELRSKNSFQQQTAKADLPSISLDVSTGQDNVAPGKETCFVATSNGGERKEIPNGVSSRIESMVQISSR
jgi:hypothetical protein